MSKETDQTEYNPYTYILYAYFFIIPHNSQSVLSDYILSEFMDLCKSARDSVKHNE